MTKTLTEQWCEGTLNGGVYYLLLRDGTTVTDQTVYIVGEKQLRWHYSSFDFVKEVIAPVPSYDEHMELVSKTEQLEKKLAIATKALKSFIPDDLTDGGFGEMYEDVIWDCKKALKEMEGIK